MAFAGAERKGLNNASEPKSNNKVVVKVEGSTLEIEVWSRQPGGKYVVSSLMAGLTLILAVCACVSFVFHIHKVWPLSVGVGVVLFLCAYLQVFLLFIQRKTRNVLRIGEQQYEYNPFVPYRVCGRCSPFINVLCLVGMIRIANVGPTANLKSATVLSESDDSKLPLPKQGLKIEMHDNTSFQIFLSLFKNVDKALVRDAINTHLQVLASRRPNNGGGAYVGGAAPNPVTMHYNEREGHRATISPKDVGFEKNEVSINVALLR